MTTEHKIILPTRDVRARYGVTTRTIDRWTVRPDLHFPAPLRINGRKYWREEELVGWEQSRASTAASS